MSNGVLENTAIAAVAGLPSSRWSWDFRVYFQDEKGGVREYVNNSGWTTQGQPIFKAKLRTPLAAVNYHAENQIRVYSITEEDYLQEWVFSQEQNTWSSTDLVTHKFAINPNAGLAATYWYDGSLSNVRLYSQEPESDHVQEYGSSGSPWSKGSTLPNALQGTRIGAVSLMPSNTQLLVRVYYQNKDQEIIEAAYDIPGNGQWSQGSAFSKETAGSSISAIAWLSSGQAHLRVYSQNDKGGFTTDRFVATAWEKNNSVILSLPTGWNSAATQWNSGEKIRFYTQGPGGAIFERYKDNDGDWQFGSFMGTA